VLITEKGTTMHVTLTDLVTRAGHGPRKHTAAYWLHDSGHQFSNLATHNPVGMIWILAIIAVIALIATGSLRRSRRDAR